MKPLIDLLRQKNNYLVQFEKIGSFECRRLQAGDYSRLERFYYRRQIILDVIENIDKHLKKHKTGELSGRHKKTALKLFQEQRKIVKSILRQDMIIHSCLNSLPGEDRIEDQIA